MIAYLDNSATTKVFDSVKDIMVQTMTRDFGNPSAMHTKGLEAETYVKEAKATIARILKVEPKAVIFTSGGTESNNMAIIGTALANKRAGNHIITTGIEHASVSNVVKHLEEEGFRISYLSVDENGRVDPEALRKEICKDTILVSIMYVNNEIGAVEPIEALAGVIRETKPEVYFHVDAIQAFGKYRIYPKKLGIDLLSVSGHKIHGPKGSGFLYVDSRVKIRPIVFGGGQQGGMRSGTENVPAIAGLGKAAAEIYTDFDVHIDRLYELKAHFWEEIQKIEGTRVNGLTGRDSAPHVMSVSFAGVRSEVLLHALEDKGIYISAGSACSSNKPAVSRTLKEIGVAKEYLDSTLRFSFSIFTTMEEIDYCIAALKELLPMLRRYARR